MDSYYQRVSLGATLRRALRGEELYRFGVCRDLGDQVKNIVYTVAAFSPILAFAKVLYNYGELPHSLQPLNERVGIKFFITYPCRLARWIFLYGEMRRVESDAIGLICRIQADKRIPVKVDHWTGSLINKAPVSANTQGAPSSPSDNAADAVSCGDAVRVNDVGHSESVAGTNTFGNNQGGQA